MMWSIIFATMFGLMAAGLVFLAVWVYRLVEVVDHHEETIYALRDDVKRLLLEQPE